MLLALARALDCKISGLCDPELASLQSQTWEEITVLGNDDYLHSIYPSEFGLINGLGQTVNSNAREQLFLSLHGRHFQFPALVHPTAWVAPTAELGEGAQIMAGAIIQPDTVIGANTIINTRASADHDCRIGAHCHIAPGVTLCGNVTIGDGAFVAAGATLLPGVMIGEGALVGAGTTVRADVPARHKIIGSSSSRPTARNSDRTPK